MAGVNDTCSWGRDDLLSAYLDGELRDGELDLVVAHLDACRACVAVLRTVQEARSALRRLPLLEPPSWMTAVEHAGDRLSAYLDGELPADVMDAVAEHVGACPYCREELQELDAARVAIRALPRLEPPPLAGGGAATSTPSKRRRLVAVVAAAAVAAALLGTVALRPEAATAPLDLDDLATRHHVRASVEAGFSVIPASVSGGVTP